MCLQTLYFQTQTSPEMLNIMAHAKGFSEKNAIWFSKNEGGGVKGRMEFFQKFIRFGEATRPLQFAVALSQNG